MASLSNGFYGHPSQNKIINNNPNNVFYGNNTFSNQRRMMSSLEFNKKKINPFTSNSKKTNKQNYYAQNNISLSQAQYSKFNNNMNQNKRIRNNSFGNNIINKDYLFKKEGSHYNLNVNNVNNQMGNQMYDDDDLSGESNSLEVPGNYNIQNMKLYGNSKSNAQLSKKINNFKMNVNPFNNANSLNTNPNAFNNESFNMEENNNDNMDNLNNLNDSDNYNYDQNNYYMYNSNDIDDNMNEENIISENLNLKDRISKLITERSSIELKANEIMKDNNDLSVENKVLRQKIDSLSNAIKSNISNKVSSENNNKNKDIIIQKYIEENNNLKMANNKLLKEKENYLKNISYSKK